MEIVVRVRWGKLLNKWCVAHSTMIEAWRISVEVLAVVVTLMIWDGGYLGFWGNQNRCPFMIA